MTPLILQQAESPAVARLDRSNAYNRRTVPHFRSQKESDFPEWLQSHRPYTLL